MLIGLRVLGLLVGCQAMEESGGHRGGCGRCQGESGQQCCRYNILAIVLAYNRIATIITLIVAIVAVAEGAGCNRVGLANRIMVASRGGERRWCRRRGSSCGRDIGGNSLMAIAAIVAFVVGVRQIGGCLWEGGCCGCIGKQCGCRQTAHLTRLAVLIARPALRSFSININKILRFGNFLLISDDLEKIIRFPSKSDKFDIST